MGMLGIDARAARATWTVILVLLVCAIVYLIRRTLLIFVLSLLLAYLLLPVVDLIDRRLPFQRRRGLALAIVYVVLMGLLVAGAGSIGARVAEQAGALAKRVPDLIRQQHTLEIPLPEPLKPFAGRITEEVRGYIQSHSEEILTGLSQVGVKVVGAAANLVFVVVVPILSFFFLKDGRAIQAAVAGFFATSSHRDAVRDVLADLNVLLVQYMRAIVLLGLATFVCYTLFFVVAGVPYPVLLGAIAFPLEFIPMIGPLTASVIILLVAGFSGYPHLLWIVVFLIAFRLFQDYVLQPHLLSSGMELHPLAIMFGVFAGEQLAGIPGAFLSVPVLAALRIVYRRVVVPRFALAE